MPIIVRLFNPTLSAVEWSSELQYELPNVDRRRAGLVCLTKLRWGNTPK